LSIGAFARRFGQGWVLELRTATMDSKRGEAAWASLFRALKSLRFGRCSLDDKARIAHRRQPEWLRPALVRGR